MNASMIVAPFKNPILISLVCFPQSYLFFWFKSQHFRLLVSHYLNSTVWAKFVSGFFVVLNFLTSLYPDFFSLFGHLRIQLIPYIQMNCPRVTCLVLMIYMYVHILTQQPHLLHQQHKIAGLTANVWSFFCTVSSMRSDVNVTNYREALHPLCPWILLFKYLC